MSGEYLGCCWFLTLVPKPPIPSLETLATGRMENSESRPISSGNGLKIQVRAVMKTLRSPFS